MENNKKYTSKNYSIQNENYDVNNKFIFGTCS